MSRTKLAKANIAIRDDPFLGVSLHFLPPRVLLSSEFPLGVFRKDLIPLLQDNPMSVTQIARLVGETPRDVEADLLHLLKSLKHTEYTGAIEPARCRKCGFEFDANKLTKPSKCPECKSTWIRESRVAIQRKE